MTNQSIPFKSKHPLYAAWSQMKQRCSNPNNINYKHYGARGIEVCERWKSSFLNFLEDMGEKPEGHSLERINNDGPYSPKNCKWATEIEQKRNQRNTIKVVFDGVEYTAIELAHRSGMKCDTIVARAQKGISLERALSHGNVYPEKREITQKYRDAVSNRVARSRSRTECKHGHPWPEYQTITSAGTVGCRACNKVKKSRYNEKKAKQ